MSSNTLFRTALIGLVIGLAIFAMLAACGPGSNACAASVKPQLRKTTPVATATRKGAPSPRPTVTVTKHGTYHVDIDTDDDC